MILLRLLGAVWSLSLGATSTTPGVRNYIVISTRNALKKEQVGEVRVEYSTRGSPMGSVTTGQSGIAVIRPRFHQPVPMTFTATKQGFLTKEVNITIPVTKEIHDISISLSTNLVEGESTRPTVEERKGKRPKMKDGNGTTINLKDDEGTRPKLEYVETTRPILEDDEGPNQNINANEATKTNLEGEEGTRPILEDNKETTPTTRPKLKDGRGTRPASKVRRTFENNQRAKPTMEDDDGAKPNMEDANGTSQAFQRKAGAKPPIGDYEEYKTNLKDDNSTRPNPKDGENNRPNLEEDLQESQARTAAQDCEDMGDIMGDVLGDVIRMVSNLGGGEFSQLAVENFFGDHINWSALEGYSIPEAKWKEGLVGEAGDLYEGLLELVEEESQPPIENFTHYPVFRAPDNVQDLWLTEISLASDVSLHFLDKINLVLNGGIFSVESHRFESYSRMETSQLELLRQLSDLASPMLSLEQSLEEFLAVVRNKGFQDAFKEEVEDTTVSRISCLYSSLAARNLTLFNTFMDVFSEQQLAQFVLILVEQTEKIIHSPVAELNVKAYIDAAKFVIKNTDFDQVSSKLMLSFLRARSLVLAVDVKQVFSDLDSVHEAAAKGWWRLSTGQWPQIIDFISTFTAKTVRSPVFWARVQEVYLEAVAGARSYYQEREKLLEEAMRTQLGPALKSVTNFLKAVRVKSPLQDRDELVSRMREVDLTSQLLPLLDQLAGSLTSQFLSCYTALYGKPDFQQLGRMLEDNSLARMIRSVVEADWPEQQEVPAGLPEFAEKLQELVFVVVTAGLGGCRDPL